jgi:ribonuclease HII
MERIPPQEQKDQLQDSKTLDESSRNLLDEKLPILNQRSGTENQEIAKGFDDNQSEPA